MPDMIKIYPCVVNKHADLYKLWKNNKYKSYTDKQLTELIVKIKKLTPPWVRITRLIRDIPEESIVAGNKITNLRQLIGNKAKGDGWECKCIRCREAGHQDKIFNDQFSRLDSIESKRAISKQFSSLKFSKFKYQANKGTEYFLSFESTDKKVLYAFLRLRINNNSNENFIPELQNSAIVRELHTYGQLTSLGDEGEIQHTGMGKKLLDQAEKIAKKHRLNKIAVISGIGVRGYYEKLGYKLEGMYMVKNIK